MKKVHASIAFFGSSLVSAYWNGAATYYRGIIKNLHQLGYQITFYEPDAYERQKNRDMPDPFYAKVKVYPNSQAGVDEAVEMAQEADILIKASGVGVFDAFLESALLQVKKPSQKVIFWDVDAPATLQTVLGNANAPFRELIAQYDYILTYGGGAPVVDAYRALNARACIPVYNALDPETHFPVKSNPAYGCDLAFLGNRLPDREDRVMEFFIRPALLLPHKHFILGGSGWENLALPPNVRYIGHVSTNDHNTFNCSARVVLNISRQSMADYGFSPATRVFEAAGAGACVITDFWEGIDQFFIPGAEILAATNGAEVASILDLLSDQAIQQIGRAARMKVLREHTYEQRALQVNQILMEQEVAI